MLVAGAALLVYRGGMSVSPPACQILGGAKVLKSHLTNTTFDAITEFRLPAGQRWPNAITAAPDGSVWFGEESLPGVAHLYANGTLMEYAWPISQPQLLQGSCERADIWGVALWNGAVWGTDMEANSLVGLNPATDTFRVVNISQSASLPYTLTPGPDGALWFTMISSPAELGRLSPNGSFSILKFSNHTSYLPTSIQFYNSSAAYYVGVDLPKDNGGLFEFNPQAATAAPTSVNAGGTLTLQSPNGLSLTPTQAWVSEHGPASVLSYDFTSRTWTTYPTSTENYTDTTLPYFIYANGTSVWFNEHYGNRIAVIDSEAGTLTEYSEANPPVTNGTEIGNALTIAPGHAGIWFTATTGNYIGFASAAYRPSFSIATAGTNELTVARGQRASIAVQISGTATKSLLVRTSDSENFTSIPSSIGIVPSVNAIDANGTTQTIAVAISAGDTTSPGRYTLDVTVTDGLVSRTAFVFLTVS